MLWLLLRGCSLWLLGTTTCVLVRGKHVIGECIGESYLPVASRKPREEEELGTHPLGRHASSDLTLFTGLHALRIPVTFQECHS